MSRTGVEPKPPWQTVPIQVRRAVAAALGSEVQRGVRVWGGYGPTPTYRLRLADGRRAFFKAAAPDSNEFIQRAYIREARNYNELGGLIGPWSPACYAAFEMDGWRVLLLEDLGPKSAPPWPPALARGVARAYGEFHRATLGTTLPEWLPRPERQLAGTGRYWRLAAGAGELRDVAALAGESREAALGWLEVAAPTLAQASEALAAAPEPHALLHFDTRSDNLRWRRGRLYLLDWPHAGIGPPEIDVVAFAQSVFIEGGPAPERVMDWYAERGPVREAMVDAAVAWLAGFMARAAWQPELEGLPRLRLFQRQQLAVCLAWAARRLDLSPPAWLAEVTGGTSRPVAGAADQGVS